MNRGRLSGHMLIARLAVMAAGVFICIPLPVLAQQGNPEVYVDMSVLQGKSGTISASQPPVKLKQPGLRPPISARQEQPRLIAPTQKAPPYVPPPVAVQAPVPKPAPLPLKAAPPPPVIKHAEKPAPAEVPVATPVAVTFPIKTTTRVETSDPASDTTSRPIPVRSGIAGNLKDTVPSRPAPDFDPAAVTQAEPAPVRDLTENAAVGPAVIPTRKPQRNAPEAKIAAKMKPPVIPPQRPDVEKASPELVAELRAREKSKMEAMAAQAVPKKAPAIDLADPPPPPGPRGKKNMPAVKKDNVDSEPLTEMTVKLPATADPLLDSLVEKDKESLVATIESLVAEKENGAALFKTKEIKRELGSNIVKAEPMQRPYNVYRPEQVEEKIIAEDVKVAALPISAPAPRPPEPRSADEEAYVSVPFTQGLTEIDAGITSEIETRLLPVLNDNPGWKLQIQAFASPAKDGTSSARKASLARAMSVRDFLIGKGIEATRIDFRALGAESDRDPMDRVDMIVFDPAKKS